MRIRRSGHWIGASNRVTRSVGYIQNGGICNNHKMKIGKLNCDTNTKLWLHTMSFSVSAIPRLCNSNVYLIICDKSSCVRIFIWIHNQVEIVFKGYVGRKYNKLKCFSLRIQTSLVQSHKRWQTHCFATRINPDFEDLLVGEIERRELDDGFPNQLLLPHPLTSIEPTPKRRAHDLVREDARESEELLEEGVLRLADVRLGTLPLAGEEEEAESPAGSPAFLLGGQVVAFDDGDVHASCLPIVLEGNL